MTPETTQLPYTTERARELVFEGYTLLQLRGFVTDINARALYWRAMKMAWKVWKKKK